MREEDTRTDSAGEPHYGSDLGAAPGNAGAAERRCPFALQQGGQSPPVLPEDAEFALKTVFSQVDPPTTANTGTYRQLGTRRVEALPRPGGTVLVVAECSDVGGNLQLQAPEGTKLFELQRGNEDDFCGSMRRWRRIWSLSTWGLSAATVLALVRIIR